LIELFRIRQNDIRQGSTKGIKAMVKHGFKKYRAVKTKIDGVTFASKAEARRYVELKQKYNAGLISCLQLQPRFQLLPKFEKNGQKFSGITYVADFMYVDEKGITVIEDVKGFRGGQVWKLKQKLFENKYPELTIRLI